VVPPSLLITVPAQEFAGSPWSRCLWYSKLLQARVTVCVLRWQTVHVFPATALGLDRSQNAIAKLAAITIMARVLIGRALGKDFTNR